MDNVEIISVNYNTPDLIIRMIESVRKHISKDINITIIDGSSKSIVKLRELENSDDCLNIIHFDFNIHHGNGLHYGLTHTTAKYALILDSDATVIKDGALEYLLSFMHNDCYGVGMVVNVNESGLNTTNGFPYLHPRYMLLNINEYNKHRRFKNHGAPCIDPMIDFYNNGETTKLINAKDIRIYFHESGRGTRSIYGLGLNKCRGMINILVRTSGRPNYFEKCYNSILDQTYPITNIIVSCDDDETYKYVSKYDIKNIVRVEPKTEGLSRRFFDDIGRWRNPAHWNLYFNEMYKYLEDGFVMFLDDDDTFYNNTSLQILANNINKNTGSAYWRVLFPNNHLVPSDRVWDSRKVVCCNISMLGFGFNTKVLRYAKFDGYNLGDYVVAKRLHDNTANKVYINKILTMVGRNTAGGHGKRDDI